LTAGSNTFTCKYKNTGAGTANFRNRRISVVNMGS
jgi:archaellum component FlaG (FlaF/FlaG flagellin family)